MPSSGALAAEVMVEEEAVAMVEVDLDYVVLHHAGHGEPHYDLMLDVSPDSDLRTWRVYHWPPMAMTRVVRLSDHRRRYLTYEGPISGGRGEVRRVERGQAVLMENRITCTSTERLVRVIELR